MSDETEQRQWNREEPRTPAERPGQPRDQIRCRNFLVVAREKNAAGRLRMA